MRVHFQQKCRAEQKQELKKTLAISSFKQWKTRRDIFLQVTIFKRSKENFGKIFGKAFEG